MYGVMKATVPCVRMGQKGKGSHMRVTTIIVITELTPVVPDSRFVNAKYTMQ
jgi:hypothetical protein